MSRSADARSALYQMGFPSRVVMEKIGADYQPLWTGDAVRLRHPARSDRQPGRETLCSFIFWRGKADMRVDAVNVRQHAQKIVVKRLVLVEVRDFDPQQVLNRAGDVVTFTNRLR